jgi:mono/diheme cytochrome c family protein
MRARIGGAVLALLATVTLVRAFAQHAAPPWEKNHLQIGQALYRDNCIVCHDIDTPTSKKFGPSFYELFQQPKMPLSNMKPDRGYIKIRVKFGGPLMPSFQKRLNDKEIDTMIDYIASR